MLSGNMARPAVLTRGRKFIVTSSPQLRIVTVLLALISTVQATSSSPVATCGEYYIYNQGQELAYDAAVKSCNAFAGVLPSRKMYDHHGECIRKASVAYWVEKEGSLCLATNNAVLGQVSCSNAQAVLCLRAKAASMVCSDNMTVLYSDDFRFEKHSRNYSLGLCRDTGGSLLTSAELTSSTMLKSCYRDIARFFQPSKFKPSLLAPSFWTKDNKCLVEDANGDPMETSCSTMHYTLCMQKFKTIAECDSDKLIVYHPIDNYRSARLTWSDASESCKGTHGRLLPHDIQRRGSLFTCVSRAFTDFQRYIPYITPELVFNFAWTSQPSTAPNAPGLCNAIGLKNDEMSVVINCETIARYLCVRDVIEPTTAPPPTAIPVTPTPLVCTSGYMMNAAKNACMDTNECSEQTNPCGNNAVCSNTDGSFTCRCSDGYTGNASLMMCTNLNECLNKRIYCSNFSDCTDSTGSFSCVCSKGYTGDGAYCTDINECNTTTPCDTNAVCTNNEGSFTCKCKRGFTGNGATCTQLDECTLGLHVCSSRASCNDTTGSYSCKCENGFIGNGLVCDDVNECLQEPCSIIGICTNTNGSFQCQCRSGYTGNGFNCTDINECNSTTADNPCGQDRQCINVNGSYVCPCQSNYTGIYQCRAPATSQNLKTIISISSGVGAGVIALVVILTAALYARSHNEVHRYLKQVVHSSGDKPFSSQLDAPDVDLPQNGAGNPHAGTLSKANSAASLISDGTSYAVFSKGANNDGNVQVVPEAGENTDMYIDVKRR